MKKKQGRNWGFRIYGKGTPNHRAHVAHTLWAPPFASHGVYIGAPDMRSLSRVFRLVTGVDFDRSKATYVRVYPDKTKQAKRKR